MPALSPIVDRWQPAVINGLAALPPLVTMMFISNDKKVTEQIRWKSLRDNRTFPSQRRWVCSALCIRRRPPLPLAERPDDASSGSLVFAPFNL